MRARIAEAILGDAAPSQRVGGYVRRESQRVGEFVLRESQRAGVAQLRAAIREFGGALLADPPGTGKTVIALAVAATYVEVLVVLPAQLRAQWARAAARAGQRIRMVTFEALSRSATPESAALVIVDEAHHARTPGTNRHRALARVCAGADVLLLTATPVVNRQADRDALLALFLGARAATLTPDACARLIVRRTPEAGLRPGVRRGRSLCGAPDVPGLAEALRALPPGFPTADGALAPMLIRISLALAWCSSLAALDAALRRRLLRGAALRDALLRGRWPSRSALRSWVTTDDTSQLAFAELLTPTRDDALDTLSAVRRVDAHLSAVGAIRALVAPHVAGDSMARAREIGRLLRERPDERMVVFARHADTIRMLWRELRTLGGVVAITGTRVAAAAGRWHRDEVLDAVSSRAGPLRATDVRGVRLLLTTDLLAEGVEMPGVHTVVHADLAWTPARLEQRRGRLTRAGRTDREVRETYCSLPRAALPFVRLAERLRLKRGAEHQALREARARDALERCVKAWRDPADGGRVSRATTASTEARHEGFIAVIAESRMTDDAPSGRTVIAGRRVGTRWRFSTAPRALLHAAREATGPALPASRETMREIRAALTVELEARAARALFTSPGTAIGSGPDGTRHAVRLARRLCARFSLALRRAAFVDRPAIAALDAASRRAVAAGVGIAVERALLESLRSGDSDTAFLSALRSALAMARPAGNTPDEQVARHPGAVRIEALLILTPGAIPHSAAPHSAPPSASP